MFYLQNHLYGEKTCENIIKVDKNFILICVFGHWVLSSKGDAAGTYDDYNEEVKVAQIDKEMAELSDPVIK